PAFAGRRAASCRRDRGVPSSAHLPCRAVARVLELDARRVELVADAVALSPVLGGARRIALADERTYRRLVDRRTIARRAQLVRIEREAEERQRGGKPGSLLA